MLFRSPDGKTKVEEFEVPLKPRGLGSEDSGTMGLTSLQFRRTTPDYFLDWHRAPRRQMVITLQGESEVELDGGRKLHLGHGHILLAEDTTGQGHVSRGIEGSPDRITVDIGLADGAVFPRPDCGRIRKIEEWFGPPPQNLLGGQALEVGNRFASPLCN